MQGNLDIWDLENLSSGSIFRVKAHESIINCIDGVGGLGIGKGAPEIVTGSRDGRVKVWDVRVKDKPVACMEPRQTANPTGGISTRVITCFLN
jgi:WD40 repeat protein